jgi:hypothetical protein
VEVGGQGPWKFVGFLCDFHFLKENLRVVMAWGITGLAVWSDLVLFLTHLEYSALGGA